MGRRRAERETSAGGVVFRCVDLEPQYLLILDGHENWGLPKGHLHRGEQPVDAARREIMEETGLEDLTLHGELGVTDWYFKAGGRLIHKYCQYFLFESLRGDPVPQRDEGITVCRWIGWEAALETLTFESAQSMLRRAGEGVPALCRDRAPDEEV